MDIAANQILMLVSEWTSGDRYVLETEIKAYSHDEVQHLIDSAVSSRCSITAVKVVSGWEVIDASSAFDIRTADEIVDDAKEARERAFEAPVYRQPYTTLNHVQQGI